uniref:endo-1,4-beta-xylanase n=1 Tax=Tetradesmus obliquus TaxID=3088 RepID=A0A383V525_TETOB|eukprot:jgi/Sobl393_1/7718/SZX59486.1
MAEPQQQVPKANQQQQQQQNATVAADIAAHRTAEFTVLLPPGATELRMQLRRPAFIFGTAYQPETAPDQQWYEDTTAAMFWGMTPENAFKWFNYEPQPGNTSEARALLESRYIGFAQQQRMPVVRGHTLEWLKEEEGDNFWPRHLNCSEYVAALKERITRDVGAFRGKFTTYDVFNEVIKFPGMLDQCDLWDTAFPDAFKWAHEADPDAKLCINDFSLIEADAAPKMIKLINEHLLPHGAPIHCIGIQAHLTIDGINMTHMKQNLDLLAETGLALYITEFSLFSTWEGPNGRPISYLDEDTQADTTVALFRLWYSHPAVRGIFMWGWWDANMWVQDAGIYRADKTPKKAAAAIQALWESEWSSQVYVPQPSDGFATFRGFFGSYDWSYVDADGASQRGVVHFGKGRRRRAAVLLGSRERSLAGEASAAVQREAGAWPK